MKKILIIAQIPPPYHGQSVMQSYLVNADWKWCEKKHINLNLSKRIEEVSRFRFRKIFATILVVYKVWRETFTQKADLIYYPPTGYSLAGFYRDVIILSMIRNRAHKVVFQFHAGGFQDLYMSLNRFLKWLAHKVYFKPHAIITLLPNLVNETTFLMPRNSFIVPNGIPDVFQNNYSYRNNNEGINILFVGNLIENKGVLECIEASYLLRQKGYNAKFTFIGGWVDRNFKNQVFKLVNEYELGKELLFMGVKTGKEKEQVYAKADIFCFPTYYPAENQPVVLLEALMFSLPIITTRWRAIPDIITDKVEGFLIDIKSPGQLTEKLIDLIEDENLRVNMGKVGRKKFLKEYKVENHLGKMENTIKQILAN